MKSKRGFASNKELARKAGAIGGRKNKGRTLSDEHKQKLREAYHKRLAQKV